MDSFWRIIAHPMQPIAPATTTTTAFIGALRDDRPVYEAQRIIAPIRGETPLARALSQFFLQGAREAWIVRVPAEDPDLPRALAAFPSANLVAMPDLFTLAGRAYLQSIAAIASDCAQRRAFFIVDPPADWKSVDDIVARIGDVAAIVRENGAIYWPPLVDGSTPMPPSGAVAAVYINSDESRGVWSAPAGIQTPLPAVTPAVALSDAENGIINPLGVNAIRRFPTYGTVVWGARTLANGYVNVRRLLLFIESSIVQSLQWTVFQPNDEQLWSEVTRVVEDFLADLWRSAAFVGAKPEEAFFVRCDSTTMTQDDIANGRLFVQIGVAPTHPPEFVIMRISAKAQASS